MADYKERLTGALGALADRVRDSGAAAEVRSVYAQGASRAKAYGRIARLTLENNRELDELGKVYAEIGRLYYEQAKDAPEGVFAPLFSQAAELTRRVLSREAEVAGVKEELGAQKAARDIEVEIAEFEQVVTDTETDGTAAGDKEEQ